MPTCGTQYWRHEDGEWVQVYAQNLTPAQIAAAFSSLETRARELGLWEEQTWGPILEDRGSQVTFSALGQEAPVDTKRQWDPTGKKKDALRAAVAADLPDLEVRSGGSTSVDITRRGIDKAYGMRRLEEVSGIAIADMLFVGDRLDPTGNDYPVKATGVACHAVDGWEDTAEVVTALIAHARG
jgi:hydroxymethylpyrimidine pyrophosphatase-like HAD family hydrolase